MDLKDNRSKIGINWEYFSGGNDILTPEKFKYESILLSRIDFLSLLFPGSERDKLLTRLQMTEKEELFAKFFSQAYNKGKSIDEMTFEELDSWIRELESIVFEGKATLQGASQAKRERELNLKNSEREKLRNSDSLFPHTDAINAVNKRKDRMSKRDKTFEMLIKPLSEGGAFGMSHDEANKFLNDNIAVNEETQAAKNNLNQARPLSDPDGSKAKTEEENKPNLIDKIVENMLKPKPESVPFDASSLFGGDKK